MAFSQESLVLAASNSMYKFPRGHHLKALGNVSAACRQRGYHFNATTVHAHSHYD